MLESGELKVETVYYYFHPVPNCVIYQGKFSQCDSLQSARGLWQSNVATLQGLVICSSSPLLENSNYEINSLNFIKQ